jgi:predicted AAA+ superfamily ATPase
VSERERLWSAIHKLLPPGWRVGPPTHDPAITRWEIVAMSPTAGGRRGKVPTMPMSFRDYAMARGPASGPEPRVALPDLLSPDGRAAIEVASLRTAELDAYLGEYIRCGGLPAPVTDMLLDGRVADATVIELWRGLSADARRLSRSDPTLRKLLARAVVALGSMTDTGTLAHELDVTRPTAGAYVDVLAASFGLIALYQRELVAVESKYAVRRSGKDYESITKSFGRGIMVSRRDVELGREVLTVPAGVLLALLG